MKKVAVDLPTLYKDIMSDHIFGKDEQRARYLVLIVYIYVKCNETKFSFNVWELHLNYFQLTPFMVFFLPVSVKDLLNFNFFVDQFIVPFF